MTSSSIICSNLHSISNWSWKLPVTSLPINIALQIRSWMHSFTSVPIQKTPQISSWLRHLSSVLINILLQICLENFLSNIGFEFFTALVSKSICFWDMTRRHIPEEYALPVIFFPIHIALQIRSRQHSVTCVPIHRCTHIRSIQNPDLSVPIQVLSQIGREGFLSHYSNPHSTSYLVMTAWFLICSNLQRTLN
jgi:hypothetical protein